MNGVTGTITVLHVDDDPDIADLAATFLEREDDRITVRTATDAEAGLSVLAEGDVDCVVSDFDMPATDGLGFLEAVREDYGDLPFILYTGKGSEEVASDAVSAGVTDYMQKETGTDQYAVLANRVVNAVGQYRAEQEAERHRRRLSELSRATDDCLWIAGLLRGRPSGRPGVRPRRDGAPLRRRIGRHRIPDRARRRRTGLRLGEGRPRLRRRRERRPGRGVHPRYHSPRGARAGTRRDRRRALDARRDAVGRRHRRGRVAGGHGGERPTV
ncbi:hypothetical protein BRC78_07235 [Halobacteriales archaeon QH_8_68_33]|nr:MAG: hypothetical protein BRC78_07235 [Halobacteriales archaeon QH_8_68_33]